MNVSKKKMISTLAAGAMLAAAAPVFADHDRRDHRGWDQRHGRHVVVNRHYHAPRPVIVQRPVYVQPAPVYYRVPDPVYYQPAPVYYQPAPALGGVVGAVAGALIGSQFGRGDGRVAGAAIGAVIGGLIGSEASY